MKDISATEAARRFSQVLDEVANRHETFLVRRGGRVVARIGPAAAATGAAVKRVLRSARPDDRWSKDLAATRAALVTEERRWPA